MRSTHLISSHLHNLLDVHRNGAVEVIRLGQLLVVPNFGLAFTGTHVRAVTKNEQKMSFAATMCTSTHTPMLDLQYIGHKEHKQTYGELEACLTRWSHENSTDHHTQPRTRVLSEHQTSKRNPELAINDHHNPVGLAGLEVVIDAVIPLAAIKGVGVLEAIITQAHCTQDLIFFDQ
jgi:hypothetical protein